MRDRVRKAVESESATTEPGPAAAVADEDLSQAYRTAHDRVLGELDGERYHALLLNLDALVTTPPLTKKAATRAGATLPRLVGRTYTEVRAIVQEAENTPAGDEHEELMHDARKSAKRARYAGESVSGTFGERRAPPSPRRWRRCRRRWVSTRTPCSPANGCASWPATPPAPTPRSCTADSTPWRKRGRRSRRTTSMRRGRTPAASPCAAGCADQAGTGTALQGLWAVSAPWPSA